MAVVSCSRLVRASLKMLCLSRASQRLAARRLVFYILGMQRAESMSAESSIADFDIFLDVFKKLDNGDYPDFRSFVLSLEDVIFQMKPFEQADVIASLRRHYGEFHSSKLLE